MIAAHASTVDLAYGYFHPKFNGKPRPTIKSDLWNIADRVPYCSNVTFMRDGNDSPWNYLKEAIPPCTYRNFSSRLKHDFIERNKT